MRHLLRPIPLLAVAMLLPAACGPGTPSDGASKEASEPGRGGFGLVVLTRNASSSPHREPDRLMAQAWFADHGGVPMPDVLSFLNVPLLSQPLPQRADRCLVTERSGRSMPSTALEGDAKHERVEFVDAGRVDVRAGERRVELDASLLPDLGPRLGGLIYDGRLRKPLPDRPRDAWRVRGRGSREVGAFETGIEPPAALQLQSVGGRAARAGRMQWPVEPGSDASLPVGWRAAETDGDESTDSGLVVVEVVRHGFDEATAVVCAAHDDGHFRVPRGLLADLPSYGPNQTDRLNVLRFETRSFEAEGLAEGLVLAVSKASVILE